MMRTITLPGIPFEVPALGFGCAGLTGTSRANATRLLETAFEGGLRHFDVARYYGYGQAEGILGSFARSRRAQITITSKFGLEPPARTSPLRLAISVGRRFVRAFPAARKVLESRATSLVSTRPFTAAECRQSLETSLRELRTDYLDFFLLHDYAVTEAHHQDLLAFLERAVAEGKIRYFGIGTSFKNVARVQHAQPELCRIAQFENSVLVRNLRNFSEVANTRLVITHGCLSRSYRSLSSFLKVHGDTAKLWSAKLSADCANPGTLAALMLNYALAANPHGMVLFSSSKAARVAKNIQSVVQPNFSGAQVARFAEAVEQLAEVHLE